MNEIDSMQSQPAQTQGHQPGRQEPMAPDPEAIRADYRGAEKLAGKIALVTGGDSGSGRAVAAHLAGAGADVAIDCLDEHDDARDTERLGTDCGPSCLLLPGDPGSEAQCNRSDEAVVEAFGRLDTLVNNAAGQHLVDPRGLAQ